METLYRTGDLVCYSGYYNGITKSLWCKVIDIIYYGESLQECIIITGQGNLNTKGIFLKLSTIGVSYGDFNSSSVSIEEVEKSTFVTEDFNSVHLIDYNYMKTIHDKFIDIANYKIEFIYKNRNIEDKINEILK
jgi:hypothetical protein